MPSLLLNSLCLIQWKENEEKNFENKNIKDAVSVSRFPVYFLTNSEKGKCKDYYEKNELIIVLSWMRSYVTTSTCVADGAPSNLSRQIMLIERTECHSEAEFMSVLFR